MSTHTEQVNVQQETRQHVLTLTALLILTAITVGASYIEFGAFNVVIALAIATIKACIVALLFMHLLHDKPVNAIIAVGGFLFLGIFLMFDFIDVGSRGNLQPVNLHAPPAATAPASPGTPAAGQPAPAPNKIE